MIHFEFTESLQPGDIPIFVDASLLKKSYCERAFANTLRGLRQNKKDIHMHTGTAVHHYAAKAHGTPQDILFAMHTATELYKEVDASEEGSKWFRTILAAKSGNLLPPPIEYEGKSGREFYFEVPWLRFVYSGKTYVIVVCGTMDHLSFVKDVVRIFDYKTAKAWKIAEVRASYKNDVQFTFYPWTIWKFGHRFLPLEMHNAARDLKMTTQVVTIQIKIKPPAWVVDSPVSCSEARFDEFEILIKQELERLLPSYLDDNATKNGHLANQCPRCPFNDLCWSLPGLEDSIRETIAKTKNRVSKANHRHHRRLWNWEEYVPPQSSVGRDNLH